MLFDEVFKKSGDLLKKYRFPTLSISVSNEAHGSPANVLNTALRSVLIAASYIDF